MGIILRWKSFNYMLEIDNLRSDAHKYLGVLRGGFLRVGVYKLHPDAVMAKTMAEWSNALPLSAQCLSLLLRFNF